MTTHADRLTSKLGLANYQVPLPEFTFAVYEYLSKEGQPMSRASLNLQFQATTNVNNSAHLSNALRSLMYHGHIHKYMDTEANVVFFWKTGVETVLTPDFFEKTVHDVPDYLGEHLNQAKAQAQPTTVTHRIEPETQAQLAHEEPNPNKLFKGKTVDGFIPILDTYFKSRSFTTADVLAYFDPSVKVNSTKVSEWLRTAEVRGWATKKLSSRPHVWLWHGAKDYVAPEAPKLPRRPGAVYSDKGLLELHRADGSVLTFTREEASVLGRTILRQLSTLV